MVNLVHKPQVFDVDIFLQHVALGPGWCVGVSLEGFLRLQVVTSGVYGLAPPGMAGKTVEGRGPPARTSPNSVLGKMTRPCVTHLPRIWGEG